MELKEKIEELNLAIDSASIANKGEQESFRIQFLGSKGAVKNLYELLKSVPNESKKEFGQLINDVRSKAEAKLTEAESLFENSTETKRSEIDLSRPEEDTELGARHPLSLVRREIIEIFNRIGYTVSEGPEIEDDWHNFSALEFSA
jgi:phenylalanyl-tRNA synthetase alpha chain